MRHLLAGIDEAGYGPIMGPLLVSCVAFSVPEDEVLLELRDQWKTWGLRVGDSKEVYSQGGLEALERTILPFMALEGGIPGTLRELLLRLGAGVEEWGEYPWYLGEGPSLPWCLELDEVEALTRTLRASLMNGKVSLLAWRSRPVYVLEFNRRVQRGNKGWLLAHMVGQLLRWAGTRGEGSSMDHVDCDRLGGRKFYGELLQYCFCVKPKIQEETMKRSSYVMDLEDRRLTVSFAVDADKRSVAVGLASMMCKYLRELHMNMINAYWRERFPGLMHTAGYPVDGQRFLDELGAEMTEEIRRLLVRSR